MAIEKTQGLATMPLIESGEQLIEQQPRGLRGEQPREQHESSLAKRKLQKSPLSQPRETDRSESSQRLGNLSRSQRTLRKIAARQTRTHDLQRRKIPVMPLVTILALGTEISDAIDNIDELDAAPPPKISPCGKTLGIRPDGTCHDFQ